MKKLLLIIFLLGVSASIVEAQVTTTRTTTTTRVKFKPFGSITLMGGGNVPMSESERDASSSGNNNPIFTDAYKFGFSLGGELAYHFSPNFSAYGSVNANFLSGKEVVTTTNGVSSTDTYTKGMIIEGYVGPRYYIGEPKQKLKPFVDIGVGAASLNRGENSAGVKIDESTSRFLLNGGIGVLIESSKTVNLVLKMKYNTLLGKDRSITTNGQTVTFHDPTIGYFNLFAGVMFKF